MDTAMSLEETLSQVQSQLQGIVEQIRRLNDASDANSSRFINYESFITAMSSIQGRVDALGQASEGRGGRERGQSTMHLINPKELKVHEFEGESKTFRNFLEDSKAFFEIVDPDLAELVEWIELQPANAHLSVHDAAQNSGTEGNAKKLHGWLRHKMRGVARQWVKDKDSAEGIQTWRDMLTKYDPTSGASLLDLQKRICIVRRGKTLRDVPNLIDKFESDYKRFRVKVGIELSDLTLQNILLDMLPAEYDEKMRADIQMRLPQVTVYSTLRQRILDLSINVGGHRGSVGMDLDHLRETREKRRTKNKDAESETDSDKDTEDLDALRTKGGGKKGGGKKGGGKKGGKKGDGRADDRPKCPICKKPGHDPLDAGATQRPSGTRATPSATARSRTSRAWEAQKAKMMKMKTTGQFVDLEAFS